MLSVQITKCNFFNFSYQPSFTVKINIFAFLNKLLELVSLIIGFIEELPFNPEIY